MCLSKDLLTGSKGASLGGKLKEARIVKESRIAKRAKLALGTGLPGPDEVRGPNSLTNLESL